MIQKKQNTNPVVLSSDTKKRAQRSKMLWFAMLFVMLGFAAIFKHSRAPFMGVNVDIGGVSALGLLAVGLIAASVLGGVQSATKELVEDGRFSIAEKRLRAGLKWHLLFGPFGPDYLRDLRLLSQVCREMRNYADADLFSQQAIAIADQRNKMFDEAMQKNSSSNLKERTKQVYDDLSKSQQAERSGLMCDLAESKLLQGRIKESASLLQDAAKIIDVRISELENRRAAPKPVQSNENILTKDFAEEAINDIRFDDFHLIRALMESIRIRELWEKALMDSNQSEEAGTARAKRLSQIKQCCSLLEQQDHKKGLLRDEADLLLATLLMARSDYNGAVTVLDSSIKILKPATVMYKLLVKRCECFMHLRQFESAADDATKALSFRSSGGLALMYRSKIYRKLGKNELAAADMQKVQKLQVQMPLLLTNASHA